MFAKFVWFDCFQLLISISSFSVYHITYYIHGTFDDHALLLKAKWSFEAMKIFPLNRRIEVECQIHENNLTLDLNGA